MTEEARRPGPQEKEAYNALMSASEACGIEGRTAIDQVLESLNSANRRVKTDKPGQFTIWCASLFDIHYAKCIGMWQAKCAGSQDRAANEAPWTGSYEPLWLAGCNLAIATLHIAERDGKSEAQATAEAAATAKAVLTRFPDMKREEFAAHHPTSTSFLDSNLPLNAPQPPPQTTQREPGCLYIGFGLILLAVGGVVTWLTYSAAKEQGGYYVITIGLFLAGGLSLLRGLWKTFTG